MKLALIGATGKVGSKILTEAIDRGHMVTGIARNPEKFPYYKNLTPQYGDILNKRELAKLLVGHNAVISAVPFMATDFSALIDAVKLSKVPHYLVVGGAGSLYVAPGVQLVDTPDFPPAYKDEALEGRKFLDCLKQEPNLDWSFVCPSAEFGSGVKTESFRLGGDELLRDAKGRSHISFEDFAIAMIDEMENPEHIRSRFTVGY